MATKFSDPGAEFEEALRIVFRKHAEKSFRQLEHLYCDRGNRFLGMLRGFCRHRDKLIQSDVEVRDSSERLREESWQDLVRRFLI